MPNRFKRLKTPCIQHSHKSDDNARERAQWPTATYVAIRQISGYGETAYLGTVVRVWHKGEAMVLKVDVVGLPVILEQLRALREVPRCSRDGVGAL